MLPVGGKDTHLVRRMTTFIQGLFGPTENEIPQYNTQKNLIYTIHKQTQTTESLLR